MRTCRVYEEWRLGAEADRSMPPEMAAHLAECASCRALREVYERAVEGLRERASAGGALRPDMAAIRSGLARRDTPDRVVPLRVFVWAAAAMLALVALGTYLVLRDEPGSDVPAVAVVPDVPAVPSPGPDLRPGQWIETRGADVRVSDPRVAGVTVGPHTRLQVGSWETARTVLFLDTGHLDVTVRKLAPDEAFEVRTPLAVVRVVGTRFRTRHRPGVETIVTCLEGEVRVETLAEVELARVPAGFEVRVTRDGVHGPRIATVDVPETDRSGADGAVGIGAVPPVPPEPTPLMASRRAVSRPPPAVGTPLVPDVMPPAPGDVLDDARRRLAGGDAREAAALIRRALESGTVAEPRLLAVLGDALRVEGHPEEARAAYERAAEGDAAQVPEGVLVDLALLLQEDLGRPRDADRAWSRYLSRHPGGQYAAQALGELASRAAVEGRDPECRILRVRLMNEHPGTPEAARALADGGRALLDRREADAAWEWFARWRDHPEASLAETALAGMVQVRLTQDRILEARALAEEHLRRFPGRAHADEVRRFLSGSSP